MKLLTIKNFYEIENCYDGYTYSHTYGGPHEYTLTITDDDDFEVYVKIYRNIYPTNYVRIVFEAISHPKVIFGVKIDSTTEFKNTMMKCYEQYIKNLTKN